MEALGTEPIDRITGLPLNPAATKARALATPAVQDVPGSVPMSKQESDLRRAALSSGADVGAPKNFNWGPEGPPPVMQSGGAQSEDFDPNRPEGSVRKGLNYQTVDSKGNITLTSAAGSSDRLRADSERIFQGALVDTLERIRTAKSGEKYDAENKQNALNLQALMLVGEWLRGKNKPIALPAGTELWNTTPEGEGRKLGANANVPASVLNEQNKTVLEQRKERSQTAKQHLDNLYKTFQSIDKDVLLTKEDRISAKNDANTEYHQAMGVPLALAEPPNGLAYYKTWETEKAKKEKRPVPSEDQMAKDLQGINNARKKIIDNFVGGGQAPGTGVVKNQPLAKMSEKDFKKSLTAKGIPVGQHQKWVDDYRNAGRLL
jgi:hypothetical protein